jgi:DNA-directed RNA polymerase III subunit RPC1
MLASFETPTDHLFNAALHSREDPLIGVSECIIMGNSIRIGTGMFQMLQKYVAAARTRSVCVSLLL